MTNLLIILLALSWLGCDDQSVGTMSPILVSRETVEYLGNESDTLILAIDGYVKDCPLVPFPQNTQIALSFTSRNDPNCNITIVTWTNLKGYYHLPSFFLCKERLNYNFYAMGNDGVYQLGASGTYCEKKLRIDFGID